MKKIALGFVVGLFVGAFAYGISSGTNVSTNQTTQDYPFVGNISSKYFDLSENGWEYDGYPITKYVAVGELPTTTISSLDYTSDSRPLEELVEPYLGQEPSSIEYDVDNDGEKETIRITSSAMTHSPNNIEIIKDNIIIFGAYNLADAVFLESPSNNGFYLVATQNDDGSCCYGGYKKIRFAFEDGVFKPIWEQKSKYLRVIDRE